MSLLHISKAPSIDVAVVGCVARPLGFPSRGSLEWMEKFPGKLRALGSWKYWKKKQKFHLSTNNHPFLFSKKYEFQGGYLLPGWIFCSPLLGWGPTPIVPFFRFKMRCCCWWFRNPKSGEHQLRLVVYPSVYKGNFWSPSTSKQFENQDRSSTQIFFEISLQIPHTHTKKKIHLTVWCKHVFMLGITYILNSIWGGVCFVSPFFLFSPTGKFRDHKKTDNLTSQVPRHPPLRVPLNGPEWVWRELT